MQKKVSLCMRYLSAIIEKSIVKRWIRKVREGLQLEDKRQRRPSKRTMTRPKKKDPQTELEKLQAENLHLRAKNALPEGSFSAQKQHYSLSRIKARNRKTEVLQIFFGIHTTNAVLMIDKIRKQPRQGGMKNNEKYPN